MRWFFGSTNRELMRKEDNFNSQCQLGKEQHRSDGILNKTSQMREAGRQWWNLSSKPVCVATNNQMNLCHVELSFRINKINSGSLWNIWKSISKCKIYYVNWKQKKKKKTPFGGITRGEFFAVFFCTWKSSSFSISFDYYYYCFTFFCFVRTNFTRWEDESDIVQGT